MNVPEHFENMNGLGTGKIHNVIIVFMSEFYPDSPQTGPPFISTAFLRTGKWLKSRLLWCHSETDEYSHVQILCGSVQV